MNSSALRGLAKLALGLLAYIVVVPAAAADGEEDAYYVPDACALPTGWAEIEAQDPQFVIFGELHGTVEAPMMVRDLVCALARRGDRVLLAVEHLSYLNPQWQDAWALPHAEFGAAILKLGWRGREDGVASVAMLDLVRAAHLLKEEGMSVEIVAFSGVSGEEQQNRFADLSGQGPHEAAQAENIALAAQAGNYDHVIVLVGNLHAQKVPVDYGFGPAFDPMAMRLSAHGRTISLSMQYGGGESWSCLLVEDPASQPGQPIRDDQVNCAAHPTVGSTELDSGPFVALGSPPGAATDDYFDGFFWVGPITASPPAIPE